MARIAISIKLDVTKIDKSKLFTGQKGTYLDATAFIDLDQLDQYGNSGMITQSVTKEEKAQGIKGNILGNTKVFWSDTGHVPQQQGQQQQYQQQQGGQQWQGQQQQGQQYGQQGNHGAQQQNWQQPQNQYPQQGQPQYNNPPADFDDDIPFAPVGLQYGNKFLHCC